MALRKVRALLAGLLPHRPTSPILSRAHGVTTLKLGIPPPHQAWWQQIWSKLLSPLPNCNAVAQTP